MKLNISAILLIGTLALSPLFCAGFINLCDNYLVYNNEDVEHFDFGQLVNFDLEETLTYVPLTLITFAIEHKLFGDVPFYFHLTNILLHLLVTYLLYRLAIKLNLDERVALVGALLFCVHPLHVESVAWIAERKDVLYSAFYLGALIVYIKYFTERARVWYLVALFLGLCSILSKPMALSLPIILLLIDCYARRPFTLQILLEKIPFAALMWPIAAITFFYTKDVIDVDLTVHASPLIWIWSCAFYVKQMLFPWSLGHLYALPQPVSLANIEYSSACFIVADLILLCVLSWRKKLVAFGILFYFLSTFFLYRIDANHFHIVADRFMYLPSLGLCLVIGAGLVRARKAGTVALVVIACFCFCKTFTTARVWRSDLAFWNYSIKTNPLSGQAYYHRGMEYLDRDEYALAIADYRMAEALGEEGLDLFVDCGDAFLYNDQHLLAVNEYGKAIRFYNHDYYATGERDHYWEYKIASHMASALIQLKKFPEAYPYLELATRIKEEAWVVSNRGVFYEFIGDLVRAKKDYEKALELDPAYTLARSNLERISKGGF